MEKEENLDQKNTTTETSNEEIEADKQSEDKQEENKGTEDKIELSPEEKIKELEDKLAELLLKWKTKEEGLKKKKKMHLIMVDLHLQKKL